MSALDDIAAERRRQIEVEGWTPEHDDRHERGEMLRAAICYATNAIVRATLLAEGKPASFVDKASRSAGVPASWPWDHGWWKPTDARRNLVKAGALILAEIERLDRARTQDTSP